VVNAAKYMILFVIKGILMLCFANVRQLFRQKV